MSEAPARPSPYVGPRPLRSGERLYGRDHEVAQLFDLLLAERIVLLYSPSGAGKSSLLDAGLSLRLREEGFVIRPTVRVGMEPPDDAPAGVNRLVLSALLSLEEDVPKDSQFELPRLAGHTLASYLEHRRADERSDDAPEVLVFDQFEEVLTVEPTAIAAKQAFFAELGAALRDERVWLVVAMREDFIAGLDPYRDALPTGLRTTFRLDLLGREAAITAIKGPAAAAGVTFEGDAPDQLVNDLRQVRIQRVDGAVETQLGPHVEPVQLQVVCQGLWSRLRPDERTIGREHIERLGDVDAALATYYDAQVEEAARQCELPERVLRQWIARHLVTTNGLRTQVLQTPERTLGLANGALAALVDAHLLRTDTRRGMVWVELSHDRIVRPLQGSNARWFEAKLSAVQRQAELWDRTGRPEGLLLSIAEEAERPLAVAEERSPVEREFLDHSAKVRRREEAARRTLRLVRALTAMVVLLVLTGLVVGIGTIRRAGEQALAASQAETREADERHREAEEKLTHQLIAQVALHREQRPELAALLGIAASRRLEDPWERKAALINIGVTAPHLVARMSPVSEDSADPHGRAGTSHPYKIVAGRGKLLALDRSGQVWAMNLVDRSTTPLLPAEVKAADIAVHPHEPLLAIGRAGGTIMLWDEEARAERGSVVLPGDAESRDDRAWVERLLFSADGRALLAVRIERDRLSVAFLVNLATRTTRQLGTLPYEASDLGLSADGSMVVLPLGQADGSIAVYSGPSFTRTAMQPACEGRCLMSIARFDPSGKRLLTGGEETLALWRIEGGTIGTEPLVIQLGPGEIVRDILYLRDAKVAVLTDARISLWDSTTLEPRGTPIELRDGARVLAPAGAQGELIAAAYDSAVPVHVFDPRRLVPTGITKLEQETLQESPPAPFSHGPVRVALDPIGTTVAVTDYDGRTKTGKVTLLDAASKVPREVLPTPKGEQFQALRLTGTRLVFADADGRIMAWDPAARAWTSLGTMPADRGEVTIAVDDDGRIVAAGAREDGGVDLGTEADEFVARTRLGEREATAFAFDRRGRQLAIASCVAETRPLLCNLNHIDIFDVAAPTSPRERLAVDFDPRQIVFSADGRRVAVGDDRQIRVWDRQDGLIALTMRRDLGSITGLDLSTDGRILAALALRDNAAADVVLWDLETGEELASPLRVHNSAVGGDGEGQVLLSADGGLLVSGGTDGVVLWDISDEALRDLACALARRELTTAEQERFLGTGRAYEALCPGAAR